MIHLVLCWHFHQPDYRDDAGRYVLPWTYLHAIKDYADMASHLEAHPGMRAVVNFVPVLLEQLDDYARQLRDGAPSDPLLARLPAPDLDSLALDEKRRLLEHGFRLNHPTMLDPFPGYRRLRALRDAVMVDGRPECAGYLSGQYFADLLMWYHLAWTGEAVRREHPWLVEMIAKGQDYSLEERRRLYQLIGELIGGLVERYRNLAARGQVELSATPHSHPIAPLLLDFAAAREARPDMPLPRATGYPDGAARIRTHIHAALESHLAHFDRLPLGFWPAEGGVSDVMLALLGEAGLRWAASGEGVLRNSLRAAGRDIPADHAWLAQPYRLPGVPVRCFFRDDHLSDLIGFEYKGWFARDAVRHFLRGVEERYRPTPDNPEPVVSIILDGENAWEYYPYNGWYFLSELYEALENHPRIRPTTFGEYLELYPERVAVLPRLVAGSWVFGDFSTWMGDAAKNRAWDLLCAAKAVFDAAVVANGLEPDRLEQARAQLMSCESSDWMWWFGDYNPAESVAAFDQLFRDKLRRLYELLDQAVPPELDVPISRGGGAVESGGVMRRGGTA